MCRRSCVTHAHAQIGVGVAAFHGPTLRIDWHERGATLDDHADACAEVLSLFVSKMANDFERRPLVRCRAHSPRAIGKIRQQSIENYREPCQVPAHRGE